MKSFHRCVMVCLVAGAAVSGCSRKGGDDEEGGGAAVKALVPVEIDVVRQGRAQSTVTAFGKTEAIRKERVSSPVAGTVSEVRVLEGSAVRAGETVALILSKESQAAIAGAEAMVRSAQTDRQKQDAERTLELARARATTVAVPSRTGGIVASRAVSPGELVSENAELCTVVDLNSIVFLADVRAGDVGELHTGMNAIIRLPALPSETFRGTVEAISPRNDPRSQTVRVRIRFSDMRAAGEAGLKDEMAGSADIVVGMRENALFVPRPALLRNDETMTYSVVTVTRDSLSHIVPVRIGATNDSTVEVVSPELRAGMGIVTAGNYALADSTRITVQPADAR